MIPFFSLATGLFLLVTHQDLGRTDTEELIAYGLGLYLAACGLLGIVFQLEFRI